MSSEIGNYEELTDITTNSLLNTNFLALGRELDILEPKTPDEVYKTHLGKETLLQLNLKQNNLILVILLILFVY